MQTSLKTLLAIFAAAVVTLTHAQRPPAISMERFDGTSVTTDLGYGISLNKASTLRREWFVVRDPAAPAAIDGAAGVVVAYKAGARGSGGDYQYKIAFGLAPKEPITAFEIRAIVIDIFGRSLRTLSATEVLDLAQPRSFESTWRLFSENEASEAYASVLYVARVRTATGRVYEVDLSVVFDQVRRVAKRLTEADLEPPRREPR